MLEPDQHTPPAGPEAAGATDDPPQREIWTISAGGESPSATVGDERGTEGSISGLSWCPTYPRPCEPCVAPARNTFADFPTGEVEQERTGNLVRAVAENQWTPKLEAMGYGLMQRANYQAWIYREMAMESKWWADRLLIVAACLSGLLSLKSLVSLSDNNSENSTDRKHINWLTMASLFVALTAMVVTALITVWKPAEISAASRVAQAKCIRVKRAIVLELAKCRADREQGNVFISKMFDEFGSTTLEAPPPNPKIIKRAIALYGVQFAQDEQFAPGEQFAQGAHAVESVRERAQPMSPRRDMFTYAFSVDDHPQVDVPEHLKATAAKLLQLAYAEEEESSSSEEPSPGNAVSEDGAGEESSTPASEQSYFSLPRPPTRQSSLMSLKDNMSGGERTAAGARADWETGRDEPVRISPEKIAYILTHIDEKATCRAEAHA